MIDLMERLEGFTLEEGLEEHMVESDKLVRPGFIRRDAEKDRAEIFRAGDVRASFQVFLRANSDYEEGPKTDIQNISEESLREIV